jgi:hypothetical protein
MASLHSVVCYFELQLLFRMAHYDYGHWYGFGIPLPTDHLGTWQAHATPTLIKYLRDSQSTRPNQLPELRSELADDIAGFGCQSTSSSYDLASTSLREPISVSQCLSSNIQSNSGVYLQHCLSLLDGTLPWFLKYPFGRNFNPYHINPDMFPYVWHCRGWVWSNDWLLKESQRCLKCTRR